MQVSKWGNSLAVRLPKALVEELGLMEGDEVEVRRAPDGALEVSRQASPREQIEAAVAKVRALKWTLPSDYKFNRDELYDRDRDGDAK